MLCVLFCCWCWFCFCLCVCLFCGWSEFWLCVVWGFGFVVLAGFVICGCVVCVCCSVLLLGGRVFLSGWGWVCGLW